VAYGRLAFGCPPLLLLPDSTKAYRLCLDLFVRAAHVNERFENAGDVVHAVVRVPTSRLGGDDDDAVL